MLTGLLAVRNLTLGEQHDLWSINVNPEYLEEVEELPAGELAGLEVGLGRIFSKIDGVALGGAVGATLGVVLHLATLVLVFKGGSVVGPHLGLLAQYFPGYTVTWSGSIVCLAYGLVSGFVVGWLFALTRNAALFFYMAIVHRRAQLRLLRRFLEFI